MTDKQIKEKLKQVVINLSNIEFTVEDELKFCKEVLKRKEQECETLASQLDFEVQKKECLEQECEELKKQLTDFMNGEYCANGCAKMQTQYKEYHCKLIEQIDKLKALNEQAEQKLDMIRKYCNYMTTFNNANKTNKGLDVEEVIQIIDEVE